MLNNNESAWRFLLVVAVWLGLAGCASPVLKAPWNQSGSPDYMLISDNLVNTASQFPHLNPHLATVQVGKPVTGFDEHVHKELAKRGYKITEIGADDGNNVVKSQIRKIADKNGASQNLYILSIGDVSVERSYETLANKTMPISEQVVRGSDERPVALNDDIFEVPNSSYSKVSFKDVDAKDIDGSAAEDDFEPVTASSPVGTGLWNVPKPNVVKRNIYETLVSNYNEVFSAYQDVEQIVLVFPNDSLLLGEENKGTIERFVDLMDPDTDVLSVIGCSHGNTSIENGNSLLALGRANRVKEAFLFSGVDHTKVLEEGCWAPETFGDVMPHRGVVLTLKRRADS